MKWSCVEFEQGLNSTHLFNLFEKKLLEKISITTGGGRRGRGRRHKSGRLGTVAREGVGASGRLTTMGL